MALPHFSSRRFGLPNIVRKSQQAIAIIAFLYNRKVELWYHISIDNHLLISILFSFIIYLIGKRRELRDFALA